MGTWPTKCVHGQAKAEPPSVAFRYNEPSLKSLGGGEMDLNQMLEHLAEVSIFRHSALALFAILGIDFAITLGHTLEEWKGCEVPLWKNFGAIVGVWVPDWLGIPFFFLILTAALWLVALMGITGSLLIVSVPTACAAAAL